MTLHTVASLQSRYLAAALCRCITVTLIILFVSKALRLDLIANSAVVLGGIATVGYINRHTDDKQRTMTDIELAALQSEFKKESRLIKFQFAFVGVLTFLNEFLPNKQNFIGGFIGALMMTCIFTLPYAYALRVFNQPLKIIATEETQAE